jgi:hypothetical protein
MKTSKNLKGIASIVAIVIIAVVAIGIGTIFYVASQRTIATPDTNLVVTNTSITNQNANANGNLNTNAVANTNSVVNGNSNTAVNSTAGWKTYTNTVYGFTFKYPSDWKTDDITKIKGTTSVVGIYKSSTTQTYPSKENPMDGYVSVSVVKNPQHLSLQQFFDKEKADCDLTNSEMGCPGAENVSNFSSVIIAGKSALRSGKRVMPEGLPTDSVYISFPEYFLEIHGTYYNRNNTYDFAPVFQNILSTFTFTQ